MRSITEQYFTHIKMSSTRALKEIDLNFAPSKHRKTQIFLHSFLSISTMSDAYHGTIVITKKFDQYNLLQLIQFIVITDPPLVRHIRLI